MADIRRWWEAVTARFAGEKTIRLVVAAGVIGMALIALSAVWHTPSAPAPAEDDGALYTQALETRLEELVTAVQGAGKAHVMVTLENTVEYVYANEETVNSDHSQSDSGDISSRDDSRKTVVTVDAQDGKQGLLVTEIQPTVRGVVVACEGAEYEDVTKRVTLAIKTALNITDKRVCVIPYASKGEMGQ